MDKIDKLISVVISELSDMTMKTEQEWDQKVTSVYLYGDVVMTMRKHKGGDYQFEGTKKHHYSFSIFSSLPLYSIIYDSLDYEDKKTFFKKLTRELLPIFSEILEGDVIKDLEVEIMYSHGVGLRLRPQ